MGFSSFSWELGPFSWIFCTLPWLPCSCEVVESPRPILLPCQQRQENISTQKFSHTTSKYTSNGFFSPDFIIRKCLITSTQVVYLCLFVLMLSAFFSYVRTYFKVYYPVLFNHFPYHDEWTLPDWYNKFMILLVYYICINILGVKAAGKNWQISLLTSVFIW